MSKYKYVLLDMDGTIVNTEPSVVHCVLHVAKTMGYDIPPVSEQKTWIGLPLTDTFIRSLKMPAEKTPEAMKIYRQLTITPSQKLLESSLIAANTVSTFLRDPTILDRTDEKGRPLYQISSITAALKNVEGIVSSLQTLQKKVEQELQEDQGKARGTQELTLGDIGLD